MDDNSTKRQRQEQRQRAVDPGVSARSSAWLRHVGAFSRRPRATAPGPATTASWNGCRRPNNGDADALHVVDSAASATQLHTSVTTVHCRRRTTWVDDAGSGHAHSSHGFHQLVQSTNNSSRRPFVRQITSKLRSESRVSVDVRIISATHACGLSDPQTMREKQQREKRSGAAHAQVARQVQTHRNN